MCVVCVGQPSGNMTCDECALCAIFIRLLVYVVIYEAYMIYEVLHFRCVVLCFEKMSPV